MRNVLEFAVLLAFGGHRNEEPVRPLDHLEVRYQETIVEDDRDVRLQLLLGDGKDLDLRDVHGTPSVGRVLSRYSARDRLRHGMTLASGCRRRSVSRVPAGAALSTIVAPDPLIAQSEVAASAERT